MINLPKKIKAVTLTSPTENFQLAMQETPLPQRKKNQLLIRVEYVGLSPLDAQLAKEGFSDWQYPHVMGLDAVGTVVDAPIGMTPNINDRVMWHANLAEQGMLTEYVAVPNFAVSILPDELASDVAATLPGSGMTALFALERLQIKEGENILIEAGSGAVGQFAIQYAKKQGANVYTTAAKSNHAYLKKLGADEVFDYTDKNLTKKLKQSIGNQLFDAIIDVFGTSTISHIELLRFCGRIACLNHLPSIPKLLFFNKAPVINIISLSGAWLNNSLCAQQKLGFIGKMLADDVANGDITPPIIHPVNFGAAAIKTALQKQVTGGLFGKQVVKIIT